MSFGFAVYRDDGSTKITEAGGIATFGGIGGVGAPVHLTGIPQDWAWYVLTAFVASEPYVTDYNAPSYLCHVQNGVIQLPFPPAWSPQIFWGIA